MTRPIPQAEEESASSSNDVVPTSPEVVEAARTTGDDSGATAERGLVAPSDTVNVPRELLVKLLVFVRDGGKQSGVGPKRIQSLRHQDIAAVERLLEVKRG